ncbi:MAG TPA: DUF58 domain-containing protein [Methylibium sp.]|uniref:DUF58 domain-containing protein n=1 Tax=Methylibium sp. TaxID=2067992 RepID=UPI002DBA45C8|nr:DUF58 domain-containing protein [Methylibium sp.]HEU4460252.1 DUF58 domain-containing protein [Methylibium sp.]
MIGRRPRLVTPPAAAAPVPAVDAERLLRGLEWKVLRRLDGALHGDYRGLLHGPGDDLADLREYQAHDDVRHIDWNVTARLGVPHVRRYHEDRDLSAWFLVDLSASAEIGARRSRSTVALEFVGLMASLLARRGNRVGALRYRRGVDGIVSPGSGRRQVLRLMHGLAVAPAMRVAVARSPGRPEAGTRLGELLEAAWPLMKRRSQIFVVSDFHSEPGWQAPLGRLAQRHEVLAVRLVDPLDGALPPLGLVVMGDAETGEQLLVDTADKRLRARHAQALAEREAALQDGLAAAGVDALELSTEDDLADALTRFVQLRRRVARQRGAGAAAVAQGSAAVAAPGAGR